MGSWTEHLGEWMETTALLWLLNQLTNSPFMGTLMVTLRFLPMVVFAFIGGVVADRMDRRRLLVYALSGSAFVSIVLAVFVHTGLVQPWHILTYSAFAGVLTSFNHPARSTLLPNLVQKEHYLNAITLDTASVMASRVVGAPLAGFIIGLAGTTPVLGVRAVGAILAIAWLGRMRAPSTPAAAGMETPLQNLAEGIGYVRDNRAVLTQVLLYLLPIFLTNTYTGLLPYLATNYLGIGPGLYGVLNAAPGAGSVLAVFSLASFVRLHHKGRFLLVAGIGQGMAMLLLFAATSSFVLALLLLVLIGAANTLFMTLNNTIIQEMTDDHVRGRVMSLREVAFGLGPAGSLVSGAMAVSVGVPLALASAGGVSIGVLLAIMALLGHVRQQD
ncbi:MAG: MFS transporter [Chloroflexi bacterium]|nr:MFS transporter [Chloroflexota bacterium]